MLHRQHNELDFKVEVSIQLGGRLWSSREMLLPKNFARSSNILVLIMEKKITDERINID